MVRGGIIESCKGLEKRFNFSVMISVNFLVGVLLVTAVPFRTRSGALVPVGVVQRSWMGQLMSFLVSPRPLMAQGSAQEM